MEEKTMREAKEYEAIWKAMDELSQAATRVQDTVAVLDTVLGLTEDMRSQTMARHLKRDLRDLRDALGMTQRALDGEPSATRRTSP